MRELFSDVAAKKSSRLVFSSMPQTFPALNLGGTADGRLVLSNGRFVRGKLRGEPVEATGEVILNTSMTGY